MPRCQDHRTPSAGLRLLLLEHWLNTATGHHWQPTHRKWIYSVLESTLQSLINVTVLLVFIRPSLDGTYYRRIAGVCFELHFRVTPGQIRSAAASSLHRRLALLATSTQPSFSKNAYLGILFAPMYQKYSLDFVSFVFYSNIQIV